MTIKSAFDEAGPFSDGLAMIKQGELFGYINRAGKFAVRPQYKYAEDFSDGLAVVGINWSEKEFAYTDHYYIDKFGQRAIAENFALASPFFKGLAHVKLKSNKKESRDSDSSDQKATFAYIDTRGKKVFVYQDRP